MFRTQGASFFYSNPRTWPERGLPPFHALPFHNSPEGGKNFPLPDKSPAPESRASPFPELAAAHISQNRITRLTIRIFPPPRPNSPSPRSSASAQAAIQPALPYLRSVPTHFAATRSPLRHLILSAPPRALPALAPLCRPSFPPTPAPTRTTCSKQSQPPQLRLCSSRYAARPAPRSPLRSPSLSPSSPSPAATSTLPEEESRTQKNRLSAAFPQCETACSEDRDIFGEFGLTKLRPEAGRRNRTLRHNAHGRQETGRGNDAQRQGPATYLCPPAEDVQT